MISLESVILVYGYIMLPFFMLCSFGLLKRHRWIGSPYLVAPTLLIVGCGLYLSGVSEPMGGHYSHWLTLPILGIPTYFLFWKRWKYPQVQALFLSLLAILAADSLYQIPYYLDYWSSSLLNAETGLASVGWSLISIPAFFYVGKQGVNTIAKPVFLVSILLTATYSAFFFSGLPISNAIYSLMFFWMASFVISAKPSENKTSEQFNRELHNS